MKFARPLPQHVGQADRVGKKWPGMKQPVPEWDFWAKFRFIGPLKGVKRKITAIFAFLI